MHQLINLTLEEPQNICQNRKKLQVSNFLNEKLILHKNNFIKTDIYYKPINAQRHKNLIPFVTTYFSNIDNKLLMQTLKHEVKYMQNE